MIGDATSRPTINDIDYSFGKLLLKLLTMESNKTPCLAGLKLLDYPLSKLELAM
jgi:hypothetical protein